MAGFDVQHLWLNLIPLALYYALVAPGVNNVFIATPMDVAQFAFLGEDCCDCLEELVNLFRARVAAKWLICAGNDKASKICSDT